MISLDLPMWAMRNKGGEQVAKTMQEVTETTRSRLAKILSGDQLSRLSQIEYRTLGMRSFRREAVVDRLGLSDAQVEKIQKTLTETAAAIGELRDNRKPDTSLESLNKQARELKIDEQKQILAVLSREQQQKWAAMLGETFDVSQLGRLKFKAPDLVPTDQWINSRPLTMEQLKGKVVALHFYAFACINCKRNYPWYKGWQESFSKQGLVVLGIHTPEIASERKFENLQVPMFKKRISPFPSWPIPNRRTGARGEIRCGRASI